MIKRSILTTLHNKSFLSSFLQKIILEEKKTNLTGKTNLNKTPKLIRIQLIITEYTDSYVLYNLFYFIPLLLILHTSEGVKSHHDPREDTS